MEKKKVLIIIGKLYIGGAERVGRDIGYYADPKQYEIHYLVFGSEIGAYEPELEGKGCKIIHMAPPGNNHFLFCRELKHLILREKYDVIHSHTMFNSGWAMMIGKQCAVPVRIAHSHSIRGNETRSFLKNAYEKTMRRLILRCATHWAACGQNAGEWLYGADKFREKGVLIHNGIDLDRFAFDPQVREDIRGKLGLTDRFVVGHVGHLAPVKNQSFLLERMPELLRRKPNALLLFLGDGPDRKKLETAVNRLGLGDYVRLAGNVHDVNRYLNAMDVFAFPSFYEGTPLAVIEAQANGLPCVISDRIPKDVHLTDLLTVLPLEDSNESWIDGVCGAQRQDSACYVQIMKDAGFDTAGMLRRIYSLYEGNVV